MKTRAHWIALAGGLVPGPILGFTFAFNPGTCNPNFSDVNFFALNGFGLLTSIGILWSIWKAMTFGGKGTG